MSLFSTTGMTSKVNMSLEMEVQKNHYLNEDLKTIILLKLPEKSLARFKCVCKSWYSLINSLDHKDYIVSFSHYSRALTFISYDTFEVSSNPKALDPHFRHDHVSLRGASNGLLCFGTSEDHYVINPATSKCKRTAREPELPYVESVSYGFGFDPTTDDYKLVRVSIRSGSYVFSLRNDCWRLVHHGVLGGLLRICETWSRAVVKNVVHWCAILKGKDGHRPVGITRFNLVDNVFKDMIRIPANLKYRESGDCVHRCCVVKDCLSVAVLFEDDDSIELWVMNMYGVMRSWTKLYCLSLSHLLQHTCHWMSEFEIGFRGEVLVHEGWRLLVLRPISGEDFEILFDRRNVLFEGIFVNYREFFKQDKKPKFLA